MTSFTLVTFSQLSITIEYEVPRPPIRRPHPFSFGWLDPTFKGFILKCYRELNWGENWKPFELFALFNQILKRILDFRSDKPILDGYDPKIRCNIDSKGFWILLGIKIICQSIITNGAKDSCAKERKIWGYYVRSEMVLWHLEFTPQVRLTINGVQFVP